MSRVTFEEFKERSRKIHGSKYDYSKVNYVNTKTKVCIVCPKHGEFWQKPSDHLRGCGCQACSKVNRLTNETFIKKAKLVHGDKYDYSKVEYKKSNEKVCIICPKHGEFWQKPAEHLVGYGCAKCANNVSPTTEDWIERAKKVHNGKYDYSKVNYVNNTTKVCIICPEHGEFWQVPKNHLKGQGCPKCGHQKNSLIGRMTLDEFINRANKIHKGKYNYSKVEYVNSYTKVCIICLEHGEFWQRPSKHLCGQGCSVCAGVKRGDTNAFVKKANEVHKEKYDYSKTIYVNAREKLCITCPQHGDFWQKSNDHLFGHGCPICGKTYSQPEIDIFEFVKELCPDAEHGNRKILDGYELDVYVPSKKLAIEYDGLIWHSEKYVDDRSYHLKKTEECEKQGIQLIHIFEDEWLEHPEIVKSKLKHILQANSGLPKIFARKCSIKEIDTQQSRTFLDKNHIQGFVRASLHLGCFHNDNLVGVMSFIESPKGSNNWELVRFATDIKYNCCGVGGKMLKYFITNYQPKNIKSFADRRWSTPIKETLYEKLNFKLVGYVRPDYQYVENQRRNHKFNYRKKLLIRRYSEFELTMDMTESEMTQKIGLWRIWNCGLLKYVWECE